MDRKQQLLLRNVIGGVGLLVILALVLAWCGVFEGAESDEAQIRALIDQSKEEINDHDWDDFLRLCHLNDADRQAWRDGIPRQANFVIIDSLVPKGLISVPAGSTEYEVNVHAVAHMSVMGRSVQADAVDGTMFFVKVDGRWKIDLDRSSSTFPYIPKPNK